MALAREGYGMGFPSHGIMQLEWGTLKVHSFKELDGLMISFFFHAAFKTVDLDGCQSLQA